MAVNRQARQGQMKTAEATPALLPVTPVRYMLPSLLPLPLGLPGLIPSWVTRSVTPPGSHLPITRGTLTPPPLYEGGWVTHTPSRNPPG